MPRDPKLCAWVLQAFGNDMPGGPCTPVPLAEATKPRSPALRTAGWVTLLTGTTMLVGGGTTYNVFGSDVCVTKYSINEGSCRNPDLARYGLAAIGAGVAMIWIGHQKVAVHPTVSRQQVGVTAKVVW